MTFPRVAAPRTNLIQRTRPPADSLEHLEQLELLELLKLLKRLRIRRSP